MTMRQHHDSPPSAGGALSWRVRAVPAVGASAPSARAVTRVESSSPSLESRRAAKIDWLNATFDHPAMSLHGLVQFISTLMDGMVTAQMDGGLFGFTERHRMTAHLSDGSRV